MFIHQRRYVDIPSLLDIDQTIRNEIFARAGGWFVFAVSRNPFSRAVSVFENKVRLGEPRYLALEAKYGDRGPFGDARDAFKAFVHEVLCDPSRRDQDPHFSAQTRLLMPDIVPYARIYRLDEISLMVKELAAHINALGGSATPTPPRENEGLGGPWRDYYDEATAAAIGHAYAQDFAALGYDSEDWRGGSGTIVEPHWMRRWRAEVVERNATIDRLYDWLGLAKQS